MTQEKYFAEVRIDKRLFKKKAKELLADYNQEHSFGNPITEKELDIFVDRYHSEIQKKLNELVFDVLYQNSQDIIYDLFELNIIREPKRYFECS